MAEDVSVRSAHSLVIAAIGPGWIKWPGYGNTPSRGTPGNTFSSEFFDKLLAYISASIETNVNDESVFKHFCQKRSVEF